MPEAPYSIYLFETGRMRMLGFYLTPVNGEEPLYQHRSSSLAVGAVADKPHMIHS